MESHPVPAAHGRAAAGVVWALLDPVVIVGLVMLLTEVVKQAALRAGVDPPMVKQVVVPVTVMLLSAALQALNAYLFGGPSVGHLEPGALRRAVVEGLQLGAMASGVYGLGKAALGRS